MSSALQTKLDSLVLLFLNHFPWRSEYLVLAFMSFLWIVSPLFEYIYLTIKVLLEKLNGLQPPRLSDTYTATFEMDSNTSAKATDSGLGGSESMTTDNKDEIPFKPTRKFSTAFHQVKLADWPKLIKYIIFIFYSRGVLRSLGRDGGGDFLGFRNPSHLANILAGQKNFIILRWIL